MMKFKHGNRRKALEYEKALVAHWKKEKTFEKSIENRAGAERFVFYDGPPFITGTPHHGTLLTSIVKDAVPRYWTMQGKQVARRWGWDCHGLPAEVFTEKKLGITDKRDIGTKISLEEYITTCRTNMVQTGSEWEDTIDRIGRWVDFKGSYKTMDKEFMESVWWAFKELYQKDKIYEGERVLLYCTRDATPISKAEVAMDNSYQDVTDPSVYVKFKLKDEERSLLAWTTTPWTLPSNSAVAVHSDIEYSEVKLESGEVLIVASNRLEAVLTDEKHKVLSYKVVKTFKGSNLVGKSYEPLFSPEDSLASDSNAFKIWHADFVNSEDGTGIAHMSPAYGEDDYDLSAANKIPWVMSTDESGIFTMGEWKEANVWEVNKQLAKDLKERGDVWKIDYITHSYPHCHRCGTKLMYRAHPSWFMSIDGQKKEMIDQNNNISWFPKHIKHGRFEKTMESAPDWNLSRDRFWATPMPVWKGINEKGEELIKVIGSYAELKELSGVELDDYHRPWIDDVTFTIDNVEYSRIEKVMDCWFESGSMPFAQHHYPFENKAVFEDNFPADFIVEYVPQVRAWFYYMHAISTGLFGKHAFKNAIVHGTLAGDDGRKMSKSFGNYTNPHELMDTYSADALRFLFLSSTLLNGEDYALVDQNVADTNRKLAMIWNMYDFFTMYAEVDNWTWDGSFNDPTNKTTHELDHWILSRTHQLVAEVEVAMNEYDIPSAMKPILPFIDDASNWYVRRSRKRFWKSDNDEDKNAAYKTLHYVLLKLSMVLAPFTPFLAEELYRNLTGEESVHLQDWPTSGTIDESLVESMSHARKIVTSGLAERSRAQIKTRQPLASATINTEPVLSDSIKQIVIEELNVKALHTGKLEKDVELDTTISEELKLEGISRDIIRHIQSARKAAAFSVEDRIDLKIASVDEEIMLSIDQHKNEILSETLTNDFQKERSYAYSCDVKMSSLMLTISISKANE